MTLQARQRSVYAIVPGRVSKVSTQYLPSAVDADTSCCGCRYLVLSKGDAEPNANALADFCAITVREGMSRDEMWNKATIVQRSCDLLIGIAAVAEGTGQLGNMPKAGVLVSMKNAL